MKQRIAIVTGILLATAAMAPSASASGLVGDAFEFGAFVGDYGDCVLLSCEACDFGGGVGGYVLCSPNQLFINYLAWGEDPDDEEP